MGIYRKVNLSLKNGLITSATCSICKNIFPKLGKYKIMSNYITNISQQGVDLILVSIGHRFINCRKAKAQNYVGNAPAVFKIS